MWFGTVQIREEPISLNLKKNNNKKNVIMSGSLNTALEKRGASTVHVESALFEVRCVPTHATHWQQEQSAGI